MTRWRPAASSPQPGMWWWATYYARPATDEEATARARERLSLMLTGLAAIGVPVEGDLGSSSPLEAIDKVCADHQFDEIIVATLPQHVSRWGRVATMISSNWIGAHFV